jgi:hypothetical protein
VPFLIFKLKEVKKFRRESGSHKIERTGGAKLGYGQMIMWIVLIVFIHAY